MHVCVHGCGVGLMSTVTTHGHFLSTAERALYPQKGSCVAGCHRCCATLSSIIAKLFAMPCCTCAAACRVVLCFEFHQIQDHTFCSGSSASRRAGLPPCASHMLLRPLIPAASQPGGAATIFGGPEIQHSSRWHQAGHGPPCMRHASQLLSMLGASPPHVNIWAGAAC